MKATEQYFALVLFIMLHKVDLTFESVDKILKCDYSEWKPLSRTFLWYCLSLTMLYKVVLNLSLGLNEILKWDHSNESYWAVLSCGTVYYVV